MVQNKFNLPWRYYVGVLGMTGQTAYYGLKDISDPQEVRKSSYRPSSTILMANRGRHYTYQPQLEQLDRE